DLDVLVIDVDTLEAVDFLDLVDQVSLQFLDAADGKDVMRVERAVHERLAGPDHVTLLNVDVDAAWYRVLAPLAIWRFVDYATQAVCDRTEFDGTVDFGHDRGLARLAGFEELDHARQTAGDVLGLGGLARNLCDDIARGDSDVFLLLLYLGEG